MTKFGDPKLTESPVRSTYRLSKWSNGRKRLDCLSQFLFGFQSDTRTLVLTLDRGTIVKIDRSATVKSKCTVCTGTDRRQTCQSSVNLTETGRVSVKFTCPYPEDFFTVEILREIVCEDRSCSENIAPKHLPPLGVFNRTLTWNLKAPGPQAFRLDFTETGFRQILPEVGCPDKHVYSLLALERIGTANVGTFCRHGSIKGAQVLNGGRFSLEVPGNISLDTTVFAVSMGNEIKSLALIGVTLPEKTISEEFFSPNYPESFPDNDLTTWEFHVPPNYYATVRIVNHTEPRCLKRHTGVEYQRMGRPTMVKKLSDPQPAELQGSFNFSLSNCEMDLKQTQSRGLSLRFSISTIDRDSAAMCIVDLREEKGLSIHIEKRKPSSSCVLKRNSVAQNAVTVSSGAVSYLSFLDCPEEDVLLTVNKTIERQEWRDWQNSSLPLVVPFLDRCLVGRLQKVNWHIRGPKEGTAVLQSLSGSLKQSLPGHRCNNSVLFQITNDEDDGVSVGQFCPRGAIHQVQIRGASITVSALPTADRDMKHASRPFLNVTFRQDITERYILTVMPKMGVPTVLATPGWPAGMKSSTTVSWIVNLPSKTEAVLQFTNITQPKCEKRHTGIKVQVQGSREEMYSRREDEMAEDVIVPNSFYLNVSNCIPECDAFNVITQITLRKRKNTLLITILSIVGALLALMLIVLAVVCVVIRKKKKQMAHQVSVYNPNGHNFLPGLHGIPRMEEDDTHIYDYIEDTMVYGHLLKDEMEMKQYKQPPVDVYHSFTGPTDPKSLLKSSEEPEVGVYRPFIGPTDRSVGVPDKTKVEEDNLKSKNQHLIDNELYDSKIGMDTMRAPEPGTEEEEEEEEESDVRL
ncbi:CUB domain-containing protein 1a [Chanos chanos]|uniref:CUB domain-containing protein 1a n=1 Tax=Chanos chanos TaxID=29144 RepID=A0A6J2W6X5_CHACN|nr:CUB domain-containing protein 1-like [Chanos chanos]